MVFEYQLEEDLKKFCLKYKLDFLTYAAIKDFIDERINYELEYLIIKQ